MRARSLAAIMAALRALRVTKTGPTIAQAAPLLARRMRLRGMETLETNACVCEFIGNKAHEPHGTMDEDEQTESRRNAYLEPRVGPSSCTYPELQTWRGQCESMAETAISSGGLSHDWSVELYSESIDRALPLLPDPLRGPALLLAAEVFDYRTPMEREQINRWNAENGYCLHGITLDCCPLGCGSILDD
jgi:hypothetical protein